MTEPAYNYRPATERCTMAEHNGHPAAGCGVTAGRHGRARGRTRTGTTIAKLQHHFYDMDQQLEASTLGMWVFLVTEIMFFGGLFMAYILYRYWYPDAWAAASNHLNVVDGRREHRSC